MSQNNKQQVELTQEQIERLDSIYNGVHELTATLIDTPVDGLGWDMSLIGPLAEYAIEYLRSKQYSISYPGIIEHEDGTQTYCNGTEKLELTPEEKNMDSNWVPMMKQAEKNGFITHSYGGMTIMCTHAEQIRSKTQQEYFKQQRMNGICPKDLGYEGCELVGNCPACYINKKKLEQEA